MRRDPLIIALDSKNLELGESITLRELVKTSKLCVVACSEKLRSSWAPWLIGEDLGNAGYSFRRDSKKCTYIFTRTK